MQVETTQLIPGCIVSEDIFGKTNHPIIKKDTVLTEELIDLLQAFLIKTIHVSRNLNDGSQLFIENETTERPQVNQSLNQASDVSRPSFSTDYQTVVTQYERMFNHWQANMPIDMPKIRDFLIPLLKRVEEENMLIYHLHTYSNKQQYLYYHDVAVSLLSAFLAKKMGYEKGEWIQIGLAGFLSNCGMAKIKLNALKKGSNLSHDKREELKKHPVYSYRLIESVRTITDAVKLAVLQHHERLDGTGYPLAVTKEKIHQYARIIAVSDTYYALTMEQNFLEKRSPATALKVLQDDYALTLDPAIIHVLVNHYQTLR